MGSKIIKTLKLYYENVSLNRKSEIVLWRPVWSHIPANDPVEFDLAPIRSKRLGNNYYSNKFSSRPQMDSPAVHELKKAGQFSSEVESQKQVVICGGFSRYQDDSTAKGKPKKFMRHSDVMSFDPQVGWPRKIEETQVDQFLTSNILTRLFPTVSYALVPAGAKLAHYGLWKEIARDCEIVECREHCQNGRAAVF